MKHCLSLFLLYFFLQATAFTQPRTDSLRRALQHARHDTTKVSAMIFLGEEIYLNQPDSALMLWEKAFTIADKNLQQEKQAVLRKTYLTYGALALNNIGFIQSRKDVKKALYHFEKSLEMQAEAGDDRGLAGSLNNIGSIYHNSGDIYKALDYYERSLKIKEKTGDKDAISISLNNIGNIYADLGDLVKSLDYFHRSLTLSEQDNDKEGIAFSLHNIAMVYDHDGDFEKALENYHKSLAIRKSLNDEFGIAASLSNIATTHQTKKEYALAKKYHLESLALREKLGDKRGRASSLVNLGNLYDIEGNPHQALQNYEEALTMWKELNDKKGITHTMCNISGIYLAKGETQKALQYAQKSYEVAREIGYPQNIGKASRQLYEIHKKMNNGLKALEMYEIYIVMRDSLNSESVKKGNLKKHLQYEYEKKAAADSVINHEKAKLEEVKYQQELSRQKLFASSGIIGALLMLLIAGISFRAYRQKQKAGNIIAHQKTIVEEKQKEILDSMNYAKRIQSAILAKEDEIRKFLPQSFLLYKPKDIVAGDFYFFESSPTHLFYAAADCTGHGVPGALMSVVCSNALTRCVKEFNLSDPGKILDQARILVMETFLKSGEDVKDGMDISLVVKDLRTGKFSWAGANNSLWIFSGKEMIEIKANKQPIGFTENPVAFTTHFLELKAGDMVYLYTDGYADQFGGTKGKKYKYRQLQQLLISLSHRDPSEQKEELDNHFEEWKGPLEQVDDVCIIGIRC
jgi:serine phosphatase RsbU (regulator of sigma subunit)/Tfp pilus assembly protein PilF